MGTLAEIKQQMCGPSKGPKPESICLRKHEALALLHETNPEMTEAQREDVFNNHRPWYIFGVPVVFESET